METKKELLNAATPPESSFDRNDESNESVFPVGYVKLEEIGQGGMGIVYRATEIVLDRIVAVKILKEQFRNQTDIIIRFLEEASITGQLQHPGIPPIYCVGTLPDGRPYLAMKLIKGKNLEQIINESKSDPNQSIDWLQIMISICQALGYAHSRNVIHRDLKPSNIMVGAFNEVQVMDWGLAKVLNTKIKAETQYNVNLSTLIKNPREGEVDNTIHGSIIGTPAYMAPEQAAGEIGEIDKKSDVFGIGAILCSILTGHPPYRGINPDDVRYAAVFGELEDAYQRLDSCNASPILIELTKQCLQKNKKNRPQDGSLVAEALEKIHREAEARVRQLELEQAQANILAEESNKRRRLFMYGLTALSITFATGIIGTGLGLRQSQRHFLDAEEKRKTAESALADSELLNTKLNSKNKNLDQIQSYIFNYVFNPIRPGESSIVNPEKYLLIDAIRNSSLQIEQNIPDFPITQFHIRNSLAISLSKFGDHQKALALFRTNEQLTRNHENLFSSEDRLIAIMNLAMELSDARIDSESIKLIEDNLSWITNEFGKSSKQYFAVIESYGESLSNNGRLSDAISLYRDTIKEVENKSETDPSLKYRLTIGLCICLEKNKQSSEALSILEKYFNNIDALPLEGKVKVLLLYANIYISLNKLDLALTYLNKSLELQVKAYPAHHPELAGTKMLIANALCEKKDLESALNYIDEARITFLKVFGQHHPHTIQSIELQISIINDSITKSLDLADAPDRIFPLLDKQIEIASLLKAKQRDATFFRALTLYTASIQLENPMLRKKYTDVTMKLLLQLKESGFFNISRNYQSLTTMPCFADFKTHPPFVDFLNSLKPSKAGKE